MSAWLFGKLPTHGDFVSRGLGADERDTLDGWLSGSLAAARVELTAFDALYDRAPPWRFAWRDRAGWTAGALAPSVDGAGRRFPLLLGRTGLTGEGVGPVAAMVEQLLYDALAQGWDADRLLRALSAATPASPVAWPKDEGWWTLGGEGFTGRELAGARPPGLIAAMLTPADGDGGA